MQTTIMTMPSADAGGTAQAANESVPATACPVTAETLKHALLSLIDEATDAEVQVEASRPALSIWGQRQTPAISP